MTSLIFSWRLIYCSELLLLRRYPKSSIVIFSDNDRHLACNQGILKAKEAKKLSQAREICLVKPDFGDLRPNKEASDWNDLVRLKGKGEAIRQISLIMDSLV